MRNIDIQFYGGPHDGRALSAPGGSIVTTVLSRYGDDTGCYVIAKRSSSGFSVRAKWSPFMPVSPLNGGRLTYRKVVRDAVENAIGSAITDRQVDSILNDLAKFFKG